MTAACGLLNGVTAPQAHANTSERWTDIDWHMEDYDEPRGGSAAARQSRYYQDVVNRMRQLASQEMAGVQGQPGLYDTTVARGRTTNRVIRVLLWSNQATDRNPTGAQRADVALYYSVDNLYLMGFSVHGLHYRINASYSAHLAEEIRVHERMRVAPLVREINSDGSYASLAAGPEWRGAEPYTASRFMIHWRALEAATPSSMNSSPVRRALAYFIGATAEATRFGWIQNRIANVLTYNEDRTDPNGPAHIGRFGTDLQNNWNTLSTLAHQSARGNRTTPVNIDERIYRNLWEIWDGDGDDDDGTGRPRIAPFLAIQGSGI
ncbi:ribosome-inactivating family protein [Streptomyces sp. NPDC014882]|uniref:ribosome-inactivating family protein n=1 Tax=Streptomyces sp. NPDC014882 TaxID=3364927 RepID=UPI0036F86720